MGSSDLFALCVLARMAGAPRSAAKGNVPDNEIRRTAKAVRAFVLRALHQGRPDAFNGMLLAFLSQRECEDLVVAAIGIKDERRRADSLSRLAAGMEHLTEPQRDRFVDAATGINDTKRTRRSQWSHC